MSRLNLLFELNYKRLNSMSHMTSQSNNQKQGPVYKPGILQKKCQKHNIIQADYSRSQCGSMPTNKTFQREAILANVTAMQPPINDIGNIPA